MHRPIFILHMLVSLILIQQHIDFPGKIWNNQNFLHWHLNRTQ